ncbi:MAG: SpoIIE family protein phosphatase [Actinomycetota bacterium]
MTDRTPETSASAASPARWRPSRRRRGAAVDPSPAAAPAVRPDFDLDIAPNDPLIGYCEQVAGAIDVDGLELDSAAVRALRARGTKLVVPLITQGELIGLLALGQRLSERDYSVDDRQLLDTLAGHAAPALRVGQLVRQQEAALVSRERLEQELRVAQLIQQQFLPKTLPDLPSWHIAAFYRPARTVGGDFYDFITLPDGRVFIVVGDVTDKGVPAALVMASTHSLLRSCAAQLVSPSAVLQHVNDLLYDEIPAHMFVTCLALVLDPATGVVTYANAGHDLPYVRTDTGVIELRATGMPLGLMPAMTYEEKVAVLQPGDSMLLHSDGLAEAHAPDREMFGFPRLMKLVEASPGGEALIDVVLAEHSRFIGAGAEQEDDITLVTLQRNISAEYGGEAAETVLEDFELPSQPGNEREAMERIAIAVRGLALSARTLDRLKTAVAETTMNAIEHGNRNSPDVPVHITVVGTPEFVAVTITDEGGLAADAPSPAAPDLDAKLAGLQTPRGWGLFLIKNMVDDVTVDTQGSRHSVRLTVRLDDAASSEASNAEQL